MKINSPIHNEARQTTEYFVRFSINPIVKECNNVWHREIE
jgi:hypothetical protein